jgi:hypothetical protein
MNKPVEPNFLLTREYRRFAEFCDACRRYRYIGLCHGAPGVGKTLSARYYANWEKVEALKPNSPTTDAKLAEVLDSNTVFYTPRVVNSPGQIDRHIEELRSHLQDIVVESVRRKDQAQPTEATGDGEISPDYLFGGACVIVIGDGPDPMYRRDELLYCLNRKRTSDPTSLILIDEADRLKMAGLEQMRSIFDHGGVGLVFIGMPGLEKRLSRYPQLYSRVGFVHEFRPLSAAHVRELMQELWTSSGFELPEEGLEDEEVITAIIRITGGNFRLIHRLLAQTARIAEVNDMSSITRPVVEAARESLVIGVA